jgi:hypothetical protein
VPQAGAIALAYVIQFVFNNTGGSVLLAILPHATWNTFYSAALVEVFPAPAVVGSYLNLTIAGWVLALALIALTRDGWVTVRRQSKSRACAEGSERSPSNSYSPECVEGKICELRVDGVLGSWHSSGPSLAPYGRMPPFPA